MTQNAQKRGFTLIELLIVVAIIAILAAIAVPNFLEAQTRSKVARAKADMRSIVTALEAYHVDANHYPPDRSYYAMDPLSKDGDVALTKLTTPIAYMTSIPVNPFPNETDNMGKTSQYRYFAKEWKDIILATKGNDPLYRERNAFEWTLTSTGPNRKSNLGEYMLFGRSTFDAKFPEYLPAYKAGPTAVYDPSNGTISQGDIIFVGPGGPVF